MQQAIHHDYVKRIALSEVSFSIGQDPFNLGARELSLSIGESQWRAINGNNSRACTSKRECIFSFTTPEVENSKTFREGML